MQLSKFSYYADFVVYPVLIAVLAVTGLRHSGWTAHSEWLLAALAGAAGWTLLEYGLHRIALHRIGPFVRMHALHHASPLALIGAPTWLSTTILVCAVFLPLWWLASLNFASGNSAGLMAGYLWYMTVHHVVHHREPRLLAMYAGGFRRRHMVHHYAGRPGHFRVTTAFWDSVFRTRLHRSIKSTLFARYVRRSRLRSQCCDSELKPSVFADYAREGQRGRNLWADTGNGR